MTARKAKLAPKDKPDDRRILEVKAALPFRCAFEKGATSGGVYMTIGDCHVTAEQDGKEVGSISATLGGGLQVLYDGYTYHVTLADIFKQVIAAHDEWKKP